MEHIDDNVGYVVVQQQVERELVNEKDWSVLAERKLRSE